MNGKEEVWEQVEAFRRRHLVGELAHLPVDVFTLAELEFKLDIIPFDDLYEKYEVDAALIQDFSGIYVDDPDRLSDDGLTPIELANRKDRPHLANLMEADIDKKLSIESARTGIEPLYTVQKVAELLSVDDAFVLELIKTRKVTALKLDEKTIRMTAGSVQRYLAKLAK